MSEGSTGLASKAAIAGGLVLMLPVVLAAAALAGIAAAFGLGGSSPSALQPSMSGPAGAPPPSVAAIPPQVLIDDEVAAATCPGLSWSVLAAIGGIESGNGTSAFPGVRSGTNEAGAEDIWTWDQGPWHVRDEGRWPRACGVSAVCEARRVSGGRHTALVACGPDGWHVSGVAGGVAE